MHLTHEEKNNLKFPVIKFSHRYEKMPETDDSTSLMAVFVADTKEFGELFTKYDTLYFKKSFSRMENGVGYYSLPKGKVLVLLFMTGYPGKVWTTIRRWTPAKEKYYRGIVGQDVKILIEEK